MADVDQEQRTEEATPKKKEKLREEGKIVKSQDVAGALVLAGVGLGLAALGPKATLDLLEFSERAFTLRDQAGPLGALRATIPVLLTSVLPVLAITFVMATAAGVVQARGLFSLSLLAFKPERLNPIPQLKNILPTKQSLTELAKNLLKIAALGTVLYHIVRDATPEFAVLPSSSPVMVAATVGSVAGRLALYGSVAFALVAVVDYWIAHRKFAEEAKMSKQDVKDEHKQQEGRPEVKQQLRKRMREALGKRKALAEVKNASVLVCNPTHIAVALRYEPGQDAAPMILAKGVEQLALEMRRIARGHGVPIVENRPLARSLHRDGRVGRPIPLELYRAAAEVIAHIMRLRGVGL